MGESFSFEYDLPNDTAYAETCASIGLVFWARRMLQIKPDRKYSDVMERAVYNGVLSGMALDGKSFFYVNPLEVNPVACHKDERKQHVKPIRQKWFGCACCPPNIARLLSSIVTYAYTEREDTLFFHLYMGGSINKKFGDADCSFKVESAFPWNGDVTVICTSEVAAKGTLAFRIPGWCKSSDPLVNRYLIDGTIEEKDGYLYITKEWKKDDKVRLSFTMTPRIICTSTKVRENIGRVCVMRGPIVYCLEEADNGKDLHRTILNTKVPMKVENFDALGIEGMNCIKAFGNRITDKGEELYTDYSPELLSPCNLTFIPYYAWNNRGEGEMSVWLWH